MSRQAPRTLQVLRSQLITPHMRRITLGGHAMAEFPAQQHSAYVKLVFPQTSEQRPVLRTYTIRAQREGEIDIDFALHERSGPATRWARQAQAGDRIQLGGPGPRKLINPDADAFLLIGDMTALPAIAVNLERVGNDTRGHAIIEIPSDADMQPLQHPPGLQLHWVVNPTADPSGTTLAAQLSRIPWPTGRVSVWAACEFNSMLRLRQALRQSHQIPRSHLYISSYWQIGQSEDGHKLIKAQDNEKHVA